MTRLSGSRKFDSSLEPEDLIEEGCDFIALAPVDGEEAQWIRFEDGWRLYEREHGWTDGPRDTEAMEQWLASWLLARSEHG